MSCLCHWRYAGAMRLVSWTWTILLLQCPVVRPCLLTHIPATFPETKQSDPVLTLSVHGFRSPSWKLLHADTGFYRVVWEMAFWKEASSDKLMKVSSVLLLESLCLVLQVLKPALLDLHWITVIPGLKRNLRLNAVNVAGVHTITCLDEMWWTLTWRLVLGYFSMMLCWQGGLARWAAVLLLGHHAVQPGTWAVAEISSTLSRGVRLSTAVPEQKTLPCCLCRCHAFLHPSMGNCPPSRVPALKS